MNKANHTKTNSQSFLCTASHIPVVPLWAPRAGGSECRGDTDWPDPPAQETSGGSTVWQCCAERS